MAELIAADVLEADPGRPQLGACGAQSQRGLVKKKILLPSGYSPPTSPDHPNTPVIESGDTQDDSPGHRRATYDMFRPVHLGMTVLLTLVRCHETVGGGSAVK